MRKSLLSLAVLASLSVAAQDLPQPSPKSTVQQVVGLTNVTVEYSRPSAKGRKVFGELVPFGQVWRTGANGCTIIEVDSEIMVEGNPLPAGKYSVFTMPNEEVWVVYFNKNVEAWGEGDRKPEEDVLSVKVAPSRGETTETFTIDFADVKDDKAMLELRWENTKVRIALHADATKQALKNIEAAVAKPDADFRVFAGCARFLVDRNLQPELAMKYAKLSTEKDPKFWNMHTLALAQAQNGLYTEAIATAEKSMRLAQEAKYDAYVKMNKEKIEEWATKKGK
ncbi:MAG: DUF2911 domain-containing protein [Flavobacteriales bacterium]|nr:DUF2911 domain-containing protein [Flavobacteriales bacterium]